ncbi:hypothetical protein [Nocardia sp. NPDC049707]|uniref:hypothetical protein n=1 Tax=Nocardia sp. NPDC049707 TaxID=3154735 RepID=UPI00344A82F2
MTAAALERLEHPLDQRGIAMFDHPAAVRPTCVVYRGAASATPRRLFIEALRDAADVATEVRQRLR